MHLSTLKLFSTLLFLITCNCSSIIAQQKYLQSGPMLGPVTLRSAMIWVQTNEAAKVNIEYRKKGSKDKFTKSSIVTTWGDYAFTGVITLSDLDPGTTYEYQLLINKKKCKFNYPTEFTTLVHWQHRTSPPDFDFVAGSCFYVNDSDYDRPGVPYGGEYEILKAMENSKPDFMVWLGDNTYLREGDFESASGIYRRYSHTRSFPLLQPFLASQPNYATWDDHDFGTNDSDWTYPLKKHSLDAFKQFWPSEAYGTGDLDGVTTSFYWNDCQFFMMDDRWYRTVETNYGTILGELQKYWLKEALLQSKATFKFVCIGGQFLNDLAIHENFANYKEERTELIEFIAEKKIKNVIFITGDRHHSEISKLKLKDGTTIYDITSSAIGSTTYDHTTEKNTLRVKGSMVGVRNFAYFTVSGNDKNRKLKVTFKNAKGVDLFTYDFE